MEGIPLRKNKEFKATICYTRNDLADALEAKKFVIVIVGEAYEKFKSVAKEDYEKSGMKKSLALGIGTAAFLPGLGAAILLGRALTLSTKEFRKYRYSYYEYQNSPCMILIRQAAFSDDAFDPMLDKIVDFPTIKFTETPICASCGYPLDTDQYMKFKVCTCKKCFAENLRLFKR